MAGAQSSRSRWAAASVVLTACGAPTAPFATNDKTAPCACPSATSWQCAGAAPRSSASSPLAAEASPKGDAGPTLAGFDCTSTLDEKRDLNLRGENAGPLGATWNWHTGGLRCQASVRRACNGKLRARLHVGDRRFVDVEREIAPPDATFTLAVPSSMWNDALRAQPGLPYETLSLTLEVLLLCEDAPVHLVDAFVGRFGAGE